MVKMRFYSLLHTADMLVKGAFGGQIKKKYGQDELVFVMLDSRNAREGYVWWSDIEEVWTR